MNTGVVGWAFTTGVNPHQRTFEVHADDADSLANAIGNETTLTIEPGNDEPKVTVEHLWLLAEVPPSRPFFRAFVVSDLRWKWNRIHVKRSYNVPRKTGTRYLVGGIPTSIDPGFDKFTYVEYSLKDEQTRWEPEQVLRDIAERVIGKRDIKDPKKDPYKVDLNGALNNLPIQGLEIDDAGDAALSVAMRLLPGVDCYVDGKGVIHFFLSSNVELVDGILAKKAKREVEGTLHPVRSEMRRIRPAKLTTLFTREIELRFDSVTEQDLSGSTITDPDVRLMMENVLPVPDDQIQVTTAHGTRTVVRGTWITFAQAFDAWNRDLPSGAPSLTFELVRELWVRGDALEATYSNLGALAPTANWVMRVSAIRAHFRQTYRINPYWMRHIKSLNAYRLGMYDPVSGVRSPAMAMMDYAIMCSWQGLGAQDDNNQFVFMNVSGYPGEGGNPDSDGKVAPAEVSILDPDMGVLHLGLRRDTVGTFQTVFPSKLVDENGSENAVTLNLARWKYLPVGMDAKVRGTTGFLALSSSHRVCVILSAIPGSPNTERSLHDVETPLSDVAGHFTNSAKAAKGGEGPEWTLRYGPHVTARIMWVQSQESLYPRLFGISGTGKSAGEGVLAKDIPTNLLQNDDVLKDAAEATAASLWSTLLTKTEGKARLHLEVNDGEDHPQGNVTVVEYRVEGGRLIVEWTASPNLKQIDPAAFLSDPARYAIFGIVPFGGK